VRSRIANKTPLPQSKAYLGTEIDNIVAACNGILKDVLCGEAIGLTPERIKAFNKMALDGLPLPEHVEPGKTRRCSVGVGRYKAPPWQDCEYLLERLCRFLNQDLQQPTQDASTGFAVLLAIIAHLYIAWIHPFGDGNGRTARLVEFQILLSRSVPDVAAHLLSNFYNQTREKYYQELSAASQSGGDVSGFLHYAVQGLRDQLDEQIRHIRDFQRNVVWRDFVYQTFREQPGDAAHRRRRLALELPQSRAVETSELKRLTPDIAVLYAKRTNKTLTRDLNELEKMNLIVRDGNKVRANADILAQFLPRRRAATDARSGEEAAKE
jgi:Fic family protein